MNSRPLIAAVLLLSLVALLDTVRAGTTYLDPDSRSWLYATESGTFPGDTTSSNNVYLSYAENDTAAADSNKYPSTQTNTTGSVKSGALSDVLSSNNQYEVLTEASGSTTTYLDPDSRTITYGVESGTFPGDETSSNNAYVSYVENNTGGGLNEIGAIAYASTTLLGKTYPKYRNWTGSAWGSEVQLDRQEASNPFLVDVIWDVSSGSTLHWIGWSTTTHIYVLKCTTQASCTFEDVDPDSGNLYATTSTPNNYEMKWDLQIEASSGQLLLVYDEPDDVSTDLCYRTRTAGSSGTWSSESTLELTSASTNPAITYVTSMNDPGTDYIVWGAYDYTNSDYWAFIWDGSSFPMGVHRALVSNTVTLQASYGGTVLTEDSAGEFVSYAFNNTNGMMEREWTSTGWEATGVNFDPETTSNNDGKAIDARMNPSTNTGLVCHTNDIADPACWVWDGTSGVGGTRSANIELSSNDGTSTNIYMSLAFDWNPDQSTTYDAIILWYNNAANSLSYGTINDATNAYTAGGTISTTMATVPTNSEGYMTKQSGNTNKVHMVFVDTTGGDIYAYKWTGGTNAPNGETAMTTNTDYTSRVFDAAFQTTPAPANYQLDIQQYWSSETCSGTKTWAIESYRSSTEDVYVQAYNWTSSGWDTRITVTASSDPGTYQTATLYSTEWNSGSPKVRFLGATESSDTAQSTFYIDDLEIRCTTATYSMVIQYDWSGVSSGDHYYLKVEAYHSSGEDFNLQVYNWTATSWATRITITKTADDDADQIWQLVAANEYNSGAPRIRFIDSDTSDTSSHDLSIDHLRVTTTHNPNYQLQVTTQWTGESCSGTKTWAIEAYRSSTEDIYIQAWNTTSSAWETRLTISKSADDDVYQTADLYPGEWASGAPKLRYLGSSESSDQVQSVFYVDDVEVRCYVSDNTAPTLTEDYIDPGSGTVITQFDFGAIYTDAQNEPPTYIKVQIGTAITMKVNQTLGANDSDSDYTDGKTYSYEFSVGYFCPADYNFFFSTSDGTFPIATANKSYTVSNTAPSITGTPTDTVVHGRPYLYDFDATDADVTYSCQSLTWSLTTAPAWLNIGPSNGTVWGSAPHNTGGNSVNVRVSDGTTTDDYPYTLTVTNANPTFTSGEPPTTVQHGDAYSHDFDWSDTDPGDYDYIVKDSGVSWCTLNSAGVYAGTAPHDLSQGGSNSVTVHDAAIPNGTVNKQWTITITNANPVITAGEQVTESVIVPLQYTHDFDASDSDGDYIYFTLTTDNAQLNIGAINGTVWGYLTVEGTWNVEVTVHDDAIPNGTDVSTYTLITTTFIPPVEEEKPIVQGLRPPDPDCYYNDLTGGFHCRDIQHYYGMRVLWVTWQLDDGPIIVSPPNGEVFLRNTDGVTDFGRKVHVIRATAVYLSGAELVDVREYNVLACLFWIMVFAAVVFVLGMYGSRRLRREKH